jgi:hypothetical protein
MKIQKILLENFQAHKHTELDLDSAITLITGSSDSGKSSLVRALRWVFFNRPPKGNFMLDRKGVTRVTLTYDTGDVLIREKGPKTNQYQLNDQVYKALKSDVPAAVSNFHGVTFDNCQWQHPHYFLLDESPGNVAKRLNEVADLSIMDESLKTVNAMVRDADGNVNAIKTNMLGLKDQVESLAWVPDAKILVDKGIGLKEAYDNLAENSLNVNNVLNNINNVQFKLDQYPDFSGLPKISSAIEKQQQQVKLKGQVAAVRDILERIEDIRLWLSDLPDYSKDVTALNNSVTSVESAAAIKTIRKELASCVKKIEALQESIISLPSIDDLPNIASYETERQGLITGRSTIKGAVTTVERLQGKLKAAEIDLVNAEEDYDKLKSDLKICPVCGNKFKEGDDCHE